MSMHPNLSLGIPALATLLALTCGGDVAAQRRPIAFTNARIHTAAGPVLEGATLVIKNGKIEAIGKDVTVPAGAKVVDATGKTIMPGLVSAWSRAGLNPPSPDSNVPQRFRSRMRRAPTAGRATNSAATKVVERIYARQPVFGELLENGVTTLALNPVSGGFAGLGAVLDPSGKNLADLTLDDDAFVQIGMVRDGATKKLLKETFEKAKAVVEERTKPKEAPKEESKAAPKEEAKDAAGKPEQKPAEAPKPGETPKPGEEPKPTPEPKPGENPPKQEPKKQEPAQAAPQPPAKPKDPNLEVLADLLQGKRRAILQIDSAADLLHWRAAVADDVSFPRAIAVERHDDYSGTLDLVVEHLKTWKCSVLLPPSLATKQRTGYLTHPAKTLHDAGVEVAFHVGESPQEVRALFFNLMNLIRAGLPQDVAVQAVTIAPAKVLGVDKRTGSLEEGKDADLLVFDGNPLSPLGKLEQVWLRGRDVADEQRP